MSDTIAAISTPRGFGGIGIIRISGNDALRIAQSILSVKISEPNTVYTGYVFDPETSDKIDTCIVLFFKAPHSYTGEDVVELQMHGGIKNLDLILGFILAKGVRLAEKGEFTKRAFINGKMDLLEAASVIELIEAKTDKALKLASKKLFGIFSEKIINFKKKVLSLLSHIEGVIDFPFDVKLMTSEEITKLIKELIEETQKYLSSYKTGKMIENGARVVIAGKPNVGKSTLLNVLLKFDRAIVSEIPGTTRDTVEEVIDFFGVPVRLIDTAGLLETGDVIELLGAERTVRAIEESDLVLFVFDASETLSLEDQRLAELTESKERIIVVNKTDLPVELDIVKLKEIFKNDKIMEISALKRQGVEELENKILEHILPSDFESAFVTTEREKEIFENILSHLNGSLALGGSGNDELIAEELRDIISELGSLTGEEVGEDVLQTIFSRFCIGK
ncbi:MAG: tRNA uridine-5-carboxymethylaminomethyl(34) synthesis GTPase MnmE [Caldisericum sp. CG2_30_36_11]|nr:MAG: tRNA uridine-5-carboxymethylaminomethyl(34) synthesis GTPase MnmE [Caldisericum sp. CG2_30_36_11]PIP50052.1 MAG: tRNA uridine-5-carboxymethylaminomethyl(34) synthesis GTPase MnmE [Caldiserica bacterium CG23_combo_of_CG06-09_8_20_14_all_35_60]PIX28457.1 MAG: tRNA uridine-5-carboxymethylaminomethyl(34) synthesis GTPase MnmE [Caldiserica bacterium CG_4_8_14_3_um_filter_35_18]